MANTRPFKFKFDYIVDRVCEFLNEARMRHQYHYFHLCYADFLHLLSCDKYDEQRDVKEPSKIINQLRRKCYGDRILPLICPCGHEFHIFRGHEYSTTYIEYLALELELGYNQWLARRRNQMDPD